jgi:2-methylisocitrate lyase-like PEP mutase family enzyme
MFTIILKNTIKNTLLLNNNNNKHYLSTFNLMRQHLRESLETTCIEIPCAHDGLSAKLIVEAGFQSLFVSGYGCAASRGLPDTGYTTLTEALSMTNTIIDAVRFSLPGFERTSNNKANNNIVSVCVDCDTGYGNEINLRRTVAGFAKIGASAIMIEDQVSSDKRCGHAGGKSVVSYEDAVKRIRAVCQARNDIEKNMLIIARTDANAIYGLEEAIKRGKAFRQEGADIVFIEAPQSLEELNEIGKFDNGFKMANMLLGGKTPFVSALELKKKGFHLSAYPFDILIPAISIMKKTLQDLKLGKRKQPSKEEIEHLWEIVGFNEYREREKKMGKV